MSDLMSLPFVSSVIQVIIVICIVVQTLIVIFAYSKLQERFNASTQLLAASKEMLEVTKIYQKLCYQQQENSKRIMDKVPDLVKDAVSHSASSGEFKLPNEIAHSTQGQSETEYGE